MTFQILNYLDKLNEVEHHNTWIKAQCPCCQGILKIVSSGVKTGAFSCYTSDCHKIKPNPIVKELTKGEFKPRHSYATRQIRIAPLIDTVKPLPLQLSEISAEQFFNNHVYEPPWKTTFENGSRFTVYAYDDFQLIRIDPVAEKKFFYFRIKNSSDEWVNEVPTKFQNVPVFRSKYLAESVIFTEGEKVASYLQELGLNAVSFPAFVYQQSYLAKFLRCLSYKVKNIIYLEDNDETGKQKAKKFLKEAWKSGINASSYNIAELLGRSAEKNYDAADAIENWEIVTREELLGVLTKCSIQKVSA